MASQDHKGGEKHSFSFCFSIKHNSHCIGSMSLILRLHWVNTFPSHLEDIYPTSHSWTLSTFTQLPAWPVYLDISLSGIPHQVPLILPSGQTVWFTCCLTLQLQKELCSLAWGLPACGDAPEVTVAFVYRQSGTAHSPSGFKLLWYWCFPILITELLLQV